MDDFGCHPWALLISIYLIISLLCQSNLMRLSLLKSRAENIKVFSNLVLRSNSFPRSWLINFSLSFWNHNTPLLIWYIYNINTVCTVGTYYGRHQYTYIHISREPVTTVMNFQYLKKMFWIRIIFYPELHQKPDPKILRTLDPNCSELRVQIKSEFQIQTWSEFRTQSWSEFRIQTRSEFHKKTA